MAMTRRLLVVGACVLALAACSRGPKPEKQPSYPPPPADSPLAKVTTGMTESQVIALLGQPQDQNAYVTGKAFIPWYFGPDSARVAFYYKGMGRVVFSAGGMGHRVGTVQRVEYDPNEAGHR